MIFIIEKILWVMLLISKDIGEKVDITTDQQDIPYSDAKV